MFSCAIKCSQCCLIALSMLSSVFCITLNSFNQVFLKQLHRISQNATNNFTQSILTLKGERLNLFVYFYFIFQTLVQVGCITPVGFLCRVVCFCDKRKLLVAAPFEEISTIESPSGILRPRAKRWPATH